MLTRYRAYRTMPNQRISEIGDLNKNTKGLNIIPLVFFVVFFRLRRRQEVVRVHLAVALVQHLEVQVRA